MKLNIFLANKKNIVMHELRKILIICFAFIANIQLFAQSNPGYLGRKSLVQLDVNGLMGNLLFEGPWLKTNFGFSYEVARSEDFAWNFGYTNTNQDMTQTMMEGEYLTFIQEDGQSSEFFDLNGGTLNYSFSEFKVTPKWYNSVKGAIAPYGDFGGLELSWGILNIDPKNVKWKQSINEANKTLDLSSVTVLSASYIWGGRRMIADQIGLDYSMGIGYTIYQSLPGSILDYTEGAQLYDLSLYYKYTAVKHISTAKLFQARVGVSYLF